MKYFVFVLIIVANSLCALAQRKGSNQVLQSARGETNRFFAYYTNTEYKHKNSDLCILSFNPTAEKGKVFKPFASLYSNEFGIEDIRWPDDTTLYLKGNEEVYENQQWIKKYQYYKTEIPR